MGKQLTFYGTGAAEGIPSPFCSCPVCEHARKVGGKEIRRRTMFRISETACIDLGADAFAQSLEYGDFIHLHHVLVTHTHEDHLDQMMMNVRNMATCREQEPLHYYFTDKAYDIVTFYKESEPIIKGMTTQLEQKGIVAFHRLEYGKTYEIDGMKVTPLRGNHFGNMGENAANYLVELPSGVKFYYGLDTGWYLPETLEALKGQKLDFLISECTFGLTPREPHPGGHLDAASCRELFPILLEQGTLTDQSRIYLAHINHYTSNHQELCEFFENWKFTCPITVCWDGFEIPEKME
ncbi:MAG: MBL fold metallo-hydrolase [Massiliimalia sp.]|jgi:phosphoribosyl 1,2-cyclic phosphate phosphodiesterase